MSEELELTEDFPVPSCRIYEAWLDSRAHSQFTGSAAKIDARVGGPFTAWDGYISGQTLALEPCRRILQSWRTTEFPPEAPDSLLEVLIEDVNQSARLTLRHTLIPDGQAEQYRDGWEDFYFKPMVEFFTE
jgi:activator of HSP90 ATPase